MLRAIRIVSKFTNSAAGAEVSLISERVAPAAPKSNVMAPIKATFTFSRGRDREAPQAKGPVWDHHAHGCEALASRRSPKPNAVGSTPATSAGT